MKEVGDVSIIECVQVVKGGCQEMRDTGVELCGDY
jgi:hypothetical protein